MSNRQQKAKHNSQQTPQHGPPGEVRSDALYQAEELKTRMGWKDAAFRAARRSGLKVCRSGGRAYVLGEDLIAYMKSRMDVPPSATANSTCADR